MIKKENEILQKLLPVFFLFKFVEYHLKNNIIELPEFSNTKNPPFDFLPEKDYIINEQKQTIAKESHSKNNYSILTFNGELGTNKKFDIMHEIISKVEKKKPGKKRRRKYGRSK